MKILIPILLLVLSFDAMSDQSAQPVISSDDETSVMVPKSEDSDSTTNPINENVDPIVIPKGENDSELFYNYVGVFLNAGFIGYEGFGGFALGLDLNVGHSINSSLFTVAKIQNSAFYDLGSGNPGFIQTYKFQLGSRLTTKFFDPFAAAEMEANLIKVSSEGFVSMALGAQIGGRLKLNLYDILTGSVTATYLIGLTNNDQDIALFQGIAGSVELMLFKKLTGYIETSSRYADDPDKPVSPDGGISVAIGLKFTY